MKMIRGLPSLLLAATAIACALSSTGAMAQPAARMDFAVGEVIATSPSGTRRALGKGSDLHEGDLISTNNGRAQLRFADGAYMSLQPQTDFKIDQFRFQGKPDGSESAVFSLLKGGLRTITGLVGRNNRQNYRLQTTVATIGIRGTEFSVAYGNSITVSVGDGAVEACNSGGCLTGYTGQTLYVADVNVPPVIVFRKVELPPPPGAPAVQLFSRAEDRTLDGNSVVLASLSHSANPPVVALPNGTGGLVAAPVAVGGTFPAGLLGGTHTFALGGELSQFVDCCFSGNSYSAGVSSDFGADGLIAWGRWTSGVRGGSQNLSSLSYVATLSANAVTAPNIIRGYASFASSAPVVTDSGGAIVAVGAPNSVTGTLNVNFPNLSSGGSLTYTLSIPVASQTFNVNGAASQFSGTSFLGSTSTITSTGSGCTPSCSGIIPFGNAIQGTFTGAAAQRAGATYGFSSQIGNVSGAVVFQ